MQRNRWGVCGVMASSAIEPACRRGLFAGLGLSDAAESLRQARDDDPAVREKLAAIFARHPRAHWQQVFEQSDACVSPVLAIDEAADHPQNLAWGSVRRVDGINQPCAAPHFRDRKSTRLNSSN